MISKLKAGKPLDWEDHPGGSPEIVGINDEGFSSDEKKHFMDLPQMYILFLQMH